MSTSLLEWVEALNGRDLVSDSPPFRRHLVSLFHEKGINHQKLAKTATRALRKIPLVSQLLAAAREADPSGLLRHLADPLTRLVLDEPLLHELLQKTIVPDLSFERLFTVIRRHCLHCTNEVSTNEPTVSRTLMLSLACQCFINEYVYPVSVIEIEAMCKLEAQILTQLQRDPMDDPEGSLGQRLTVYAMYQPLWRLGASELLAKPLNSQRCPDIQQLIDRQVREPLQEAEIARELPSFDYGGHTKRDAVRAQYEDSPYPRWLSLDVLPPSDFRNDIRDHFPFLCNSQVGDVNRVLVAGCGTGKHPLGVAIRFPKLQVTAVDFSYSSLAYGARQARHYGLTNLKFLHGSLFDIRRLEIQFDAVECYGVLHHLEEPRVGLMALADVLNVGGWIRLGLYSKRGRAFLDPAREFLKRSLADHSPSSLRNARARLIEEQPEDDLVLSAPRDFFYLSGFRDLLCHVQETRFSPGEVNSMLEECNLEFVGIAGVHQSVRDAYVSRFPNDPDMRDLSQIETFDAEDPMRLGPIIDYWARKVLPA